MRLLLQPLAGAIGLGSITRCLALAEHAVMRGHKVAFQSQPYPMIEDFQAGRRFDAPVPTRPAPITDPQSSSFNEAIHMRGHADPEYLERAVEAELKTIERFQPDAVVTEWQPSVPISTAVAGIPFVATLATTELCKLVGDTPDPSYQHVNDNLARVCERYNVPSWETVEELVHCTAALNIAPTIEMLEPMLAAVPNTRYVGPLLYSKLELAPAPALGEYQRRVLVYVGAGAVQVRELLPVLTKAFPAPEYGVLVAAREQEIDGMRTPFRHENVVVAHHPGLTQALVDTDIVVARGSQNAVAACLLAGVPVIGTPGTRDSEPLFNLRVLESHGVARTITGKPSAESLAEAADHLLSNGSAVRSARLGQALRAKGGACEAIMAMEEVLG